MWVIVSTSKSDEKHPILGDKKYVVGRTGCDITINDPSVSRKQAVLMMAHYEANVVKSFITPSLTVEDTSKFGTFVNGDAVKKQPGSLVTLKDGDKIQFGGSPASIFVARYEPFVATTSCLEKVPKKNLQRVMCLLGGHVVRDWRSSCDLLIMAKINVTIKVICAINNQKPIVTPDYLDHFHQFLMGQRDSKPDPKDYLPEVADKEVPAGVSFHPDLRRSTLLKDLKFYFLSAHQFNKTNLAVSTAGGLPILLEDGTEEDADMMTQDGTIVVAVTRDVLSTLSPTCQKFVRTVCLVLKEKNLRMVTDPEIGWAILTCNTDDFCNPKSAITPSMYSSMASQSLSQMTDLDVDMTQHVSNMQQHSANKHHQRQHSSSTQHSVTQQPQASFNETPQKPDSRPGKRPASTMDRDSGDLFPTKVDETSSLQNVASKRIKQETQVSPSQQNLLSGTEIDASKKLDSHSDMYSASLFKSPRTPTPVTVSVNSSSVQNANDVKAFRKKDNDFDSRAGTRLSNVKCEEKEKRNKICSSLSLKEKKRKSDSDIDCHNTSDVVDVSDEGDNDNGNSDVNKISMSPVNSNNKQCKNLPSQRTAALSKSTDFSDSSSNEEKSNNSSPSPGTFLNKKGNTKHNNVSLEEIVKSDKEPSVPSPSAKSTSARGKRKKRALFCDSSDEDEGVSLSSGTKGKKSKNDAQNSLAENDGEAMPNGNVGKKSQINVRNRKNINFEEDTADEKVTLVAESDLPSSSVICNGGAKVDAVIVKQEDVNHSTSTHNSDGGNADWISGKHSPEHGKWAKVKKEESRIDEELSDEQTDLVLDTDGRPLRHLCQVKVVDLVARVPGGKGRQPNASQPCQQQTGVKNFKRFKKTLHSGSSCLPTIIGGRDLEPHKSSRLNHMDDLLEEAVTTENGVCGGSNRDGMFSWPEEDLSPKRKSRRT